MLNVLTKQMPSTVDVGGISIPINTSFRVWIDIWTVVDNPNAESWKKCAAMLLKAFPQEPSEDGRIPYQIALTNTQEAIDAVIKFLQRKTSEDKPKPPTKNQRRLEKIRLFDWKYDAIRVISDFEREYHIDLTDPQTDMHWWRFMALFDGLSDTSQTMEAIRVRAVDLDDKRMSKQIKANYRERQQALMLPARTREEAAHNRHIRGMDG